MSDEKGYVEPLLTNVAADYSVKAAEGLVADRIFPRISVAKPNGHYYVFSKEQAYKITDDTFSDDGEAPELKRHGTKTPYSSTPRGNKTFVSKDDEVFKEGPFVKSDLDFVKEIVLNIEKNRELRVRDKILNLSGRSTALSGTGTAKTNKWANDGGNAFDAISDAIKTLFYRPNRLIIPESVFDVLEFNSSLLAKLGEANMIKKVSPETLSKLFRIDEVIIAEGKADSAKFNKTGTVNPTALWGNNIIFAYSDARRDVPCAGKTFFVDIPGSKNGYCVRTWDSPHRGVIGGHIAQVGCYIDDHIVAEDLIYSLQEVV